MPVRQRPRYARAVSEREINEADAYALARGAVAFELGREPVGYRWGWVFMPATETNGGPGPVSVTKRAVVMSHGSIPTTFDDEHEPVEGATGKKPRSWWQALVEALTPGT